MDSPYEAPQGELEQAIVELWQQAFSLERVSRHDNFFALGGSSLTAMELTDRIADSLDVPLTPVMLFLNPTPQLIAECIRNLEP